MKSVTRLNERTGKRETFVVPESRLEERFILWYAAENEVPFFRINKHESLRIPTRENPEATVEKLGRIFQDYRQRFRYREIPDLLGKTLEQVEYDLGRQNIQWAVEQDIYSPFYPKGTVAAQRPEPGAITSLDALVYLSMSKGKW